MYARETLVQAAREGRLHDGADAWGTACYFLDGAPIYGADVREIEKLFAEKVFTFDHADIDAMLDRCPVRIRED